VIVDSAGSVRGGGTVYGSWTTQMYRRYGTQGIDAAEEVQDTLQCKQSVVTEIGRWMGGENPQQRWRSAKQNSSGFVRIETIPVW
jgi:hypothetical protein